LGVIEAILLGIVQGITEWLPISSTAHLRIVPALLGRPDPGAAFTATIQLGTLLAVLVYFGRDLIRIFVGWCRGLRGGEAARREEARLGWAIVVGTVPIVVCGMLFQHWIKNDLRSLYVIASSLIGMGLVMAVAERVGRRTKGLDRLGVAAGLWIGVWQAIALIPGASRSGSTISGGLFAGFDRETAARFSFLLSVPSVLAAGLKELKDEWTEIVGLHLTPVIVASLVSFVVGYGSIAFLMKYLQTRSTVVFVVYRVLLGVAILVLLQQGLLKPF